MEKKMVNGSRQRLRSHLGEIREMMEMVERLFPEEANQYYQRMKRKMQPSEIPSYEELCGEEDEEYNVEMEDGIAIMSAIIEFDYPRMVRRGTFLSCYAEFELFLRDFCERAI